MKVEAGVLEVEAGTDEKQQIKFVWPNNNNNNIININNNNNNIIIIYYYNILQR